MTAPHILYLEDDENDVVLLRYALNASAVPADIVQISTPQEFTEALERGPPDLILADSNVPGFDTEAVLALARQRCPSTPFYYLTGFMSEARAAEAIAAGATGCLSKNDRAAVTAAIRNALRDRRGGGASADA